MPEFDLFISYSRADQGIVEPLAHKLRTAGLSVYLDRWYAVPGRPWMPALEAALARCRAVAVCVGSELGPWQQREKEAALQRQSNAGPDGEAFPVIPVLLHGDTAPLGFLDQNTWIDLRAGREDEAVAILVKATRGEPPGPDLSDSIAKAKAAVCPYRGLLHFREEDAALFHGREEAITSLLNAVDRYPFVAVVGDSGSGKSSVVRAGLLPALRKRRDQPWEMLTIVPGDRPFHRLAAALMQVLDPDLSEVDRLIQVPRLAAAFDTGEAQLRDVIERVLERQTGTQRLLLVVDQWEELFTMTASVEQRLAFIRQLLEATEKSALNVVLTLRGDYFGRAVTSQRELADRLQGAQVNLGPMTRHELHDAIVKPAQQVGLEFEANLAELIQEHATAKPGNLPLLEFVLRELWEHRRGRLLHRAAYDKIGQLHGSIAKRADAVFQRLTQGDSAAEDWLRKTFLRLVRPGQGQADTRQRVPIADIDLKSLPLVEELTRERLLVTSGIDGSSEGATVEVAHEALIAHWTLLRDWVQVDREYITWRTRLDEAEKDWRDRGRPAGALPQGIALAQARIYLKTRQADLSKREVAYIKSGVNRRFALLFGLAGFATVSATAIAYFAVRAELQANAASAAAQEAAVLRIVAESQSMLAGVRAGGTERALQQLIGMHRVAPTSPLVDGAMLDAVTRFPRMLRVIGQTAGITSVAINSDGTRIVTGSYDKTLRQWDRKTGQPIGLPMVGHENSVSSVAFSPDGTLVVSGSADSTVRLWDAKTGRPMGVPMVGHRGNVSSTAFSPDGALVASGGHDQTLRLWDVKTGKPIGKPLVGHDSLVSSVAFNPAGTRIVSGSWDKTLRIWDTMTAQVVGLPLAGHEGLVVSVAWSHDGLHIVSGSTDRTLRLWDPMTGLAKGVSEKEHQGEITAVAFSPDDKYIASGSEDKTLRLWNAVNGRSVGAPLTGHQGGVTAVAFSPEGTHLVSGDAFGSSLKRGLLSLSGDSNIGGGDITMRVWSVNAAQIEAPLARHTDSVFSVAFSPDGKRIVSGSTDGTLQQWDAVTGKPLGAPLLEHLNWGRSVAFSPDGARIISGGRDGKLRLWDASTGHAVGTLLAHSQVGSVAFSPDGSRIVSGGAGGLQLWDAHTQQQIGVPLTDHKGLVWCVAFSPDGTRVVSGGADRTLRQWDVKTGQPVGAPMTGHTSHVVGVAYSPDGKRIVSASRDRTLRLWNAADGLPASAPMIGHQDWVNTVAYSPDGRWIVSGGDKTLRLWDAETAQSIGPLLAGHLDSVWTVTFSRDGTRIVSGSGDRTIRLWPGPKALPELLCSKLTHNMGRTRWAEVMPRNVPYQEQCPGLPTASL